MSIRMTVESEFWYNIQEAMKQEAMRNGTYEVRRKFERDGKNDGPKIHRYICGHVKSLELEGYDKKPEWMYFIGTESDNKEVLNMLRERNKNIGKSTGVLMKLSADEKLGFEALAREKAIRDEASRIASAKKDGKLEGKRNAREEIARNLISLGLPVDSIMKSTGLSKEEIKEIQSM